MRARVRVTDLRPAQWARLQSRIQAVYEIAPGAPSVCAEFESGHPQGEVRHVQMPVQEFATVLTELAAIGDTMNLVDVIDRVNRRPVLPLPEEVRNLSAIEAAHLAAEMNR